MQVTAFCYLKKKTKLKQTKVNKQNDDDHDFRYHKIQVIPGICIVTNSVIMYLAL